MGDGVGSLLGSLFSPTEQAYIQLAFTKENSALFTIGWRKGRIFPPGCRRYLPKPKAIRVQPLRLGTLIGSCPNETFQTMEITTDLHLYILKFSKIPLLLKFHSSYADPTDGF